MKKIENGRNAPTWIQSPPQLNQRHNTGQPEHQITLEIRNKEYLKQTPEPREQLQH